MSTSTTPLEIETLYYFLDFSLLCGNYKDSKMYLDILREEYQRNKGNFKILEADDRLGNLIKMGSIIDKKILVKNLEIEEVDEIKKIKTDNKKFDKEFKLSKYLCKNQNYLKKALNGTDDFIITNEKLSVTFGEVDIVAQDNETIYIVELKKGEGKFKTLKLFVGCDSKLEF